MISAVGPREQDHGPFGPPPDVDPGPGNVVVWEVPPNVSVNSVSRGERHDEGVVGWSAGFVGEEKVLEVHIVSC